jgi:predicted acetyltransferase
MSLENMRESTLLQQLGDITLQDKELVLKAIKVALHPAHKVPTYFFKMVRVDSREEIGRIDLRVGSSSHIELYAGHVGYRVDPAHRGHRYASRALRLLIPVASETRLDPLWITCDPENIGSRRCELAGGESSKSSMFQLRASSTKGATPESAGIG